MPQDYPHFHLFHLMTFDLILTSLGHTPTARLAVGVNLKLVLYLFSPMP